MITRFIDYTHISRTYPNLQNKSLFQKHFEVITIFSYQEIICYNYNASISNHHMCRVYVVIFIELLMRYCRFASPPLAVPPRWFLHLDHKSVVTPQDPLNRKPLWTHRVSTLQNKRGQLQEEELPVHHQLPHMHTEWGQECLPWRIQ